LKPLMQEILMLCPVGLPALLALSYVLKYG
jgi:hypothetical protein